MQRLTARVRLPDGAEVQLFAELPDKLRLQSSAGSYLLLGDKAVCIPDVSAPVPAAAVERLQQLRALLDAAAFGPLHRATACKRIAASTFELTVAGGPPTTMELRPGSLLPSTFRSPTATVTVDDYLHTKSTWIARELTLDGLGRCNVLLEQGGLAWDDDFFVPPKSTATPAVPTQRIASPGSGGEPRSPTPILIDSKAMQWAMVLDPGDWPARVRAFRPLHAELERQDQVLAGFPVLWQENGQNWLAAPFRQRPDGEVFLQPATWQVRNVAAGRWLVVYPAAGDLTAKLAAGPQLLQDALRTMKLKATGPITAQPFFHLQEGEPSPQKLAAPVVRMAVPVD